jgi:hypothetical protein
MARQIKWLGAQCECEELDGAGLCPACGIASALLNTHDNARLMQTMTGEWVWAAPLPAALRSPSPPETGREALDLLAELHALVWGECPSLLNEDSGGCARLDMDIRAALRAPAEAGPERKE